MLAEKERGFQYHLVSLESLVPPDNFYRQLEAKLDLSFVRDLVRHHYKPFGRPSVDPVVFFKLQLIMFFEGIRSERQLMEMVSMRLDHRWYIGYDLDETVPHHSSLSRIRDRYGVDVIQSFFERIVERCIEAKLVWGKEFFFDGSMILANASFDNLVPRFYWQATQQHLEALFDTLETQTSTIPDLVSRYDGTERIVRQNSYRKKSDDWIAPVDPQATPVGYDKKLGYRLHYVVDGGKSRIILACLVTPSAIQDQTPMLDLAWWSRFRWHVQPDIAVADTRYGTVSNLVGLEQNGITAFIPPFKQAAAKRNRHYPKTLFHYDSESDHYVCPQGNVLPYRSTHDGYHFYRAKPKVCRTCPVKSQCTTNKLGRIISHSIHKVYEDRVMGYLETSAYKKAMRKRQVWIEPKFGEVKQWHQGRRFRLRGIVKVNIEALLKATGQNIKELLKGNRHSHNPPPLANEVVNQLFPFPYLSLCCTRL